MRQGITVPSKYSRIYEKAIIPGDTEMREMSINCTMEDGSKASMKAKTLS
jgi:hypothetical protein